MFCGLEKKKSASFACVEEREEQRGKTQRRDTTGAYVCLCVGMSALQERDDLVALFSFFSQLASLLYSSIVLTLTPSLLSPTNPIGKSRHFRTTPHIRNIFLSRTLSLTPQDTYYNKHTTHTHLTHIHTLHNHGTKEDPNQNHHRRA